MPVMFEIPSAEDVEKVTITQETVRDKTAPHMHRLDIAPVEKNVG